METTTWEKEFEKVMGCIPECKNGLYEDVGCPSHGYDAIKAKKFIKKQIKTAKEEDRKTLIEVVKLYGEPQCSNLHHPKKFQHDYSEECPVISRIIAIINK